MAGFDNNGWISAIIEEVRIHVRLSQKLLVDKNIAALDLHGIPGHANDPLDIGLRGISGIPEHDDILAVDFLDAVDELVDEDPLLVPKFRKHTRAFNLYRLVEEDHDHDGGADREEDIPYPPANLAQHAGQCFGFCPNLRDLINFGFS